MTADQAVRAVPTAVLERTLFEVKRVVVGQDPMVERMIVGLLARGHVLLEGVPGVAKTLAVRTLADTFGGTFSRLQFTPDLMPADIVGTQVWRSSAERFDTELGPIFANLVLADEINRAPAKVQSALLEAMAERQVSIGGTTYPCPCRSWFWRPRTRSRPRASTPCRRPNATGSCSRSTSTTPRSSTSWRSCTG